MTRADRRHGRGPQKTNSLTLFTHARIDAAGRLVENRERLRFAVDGHPPSAPLLRAAQKAGVKHYFIEDESPAVLEQVPQSLWFLEQIDF